VTAAAPTAADAQAFMNKAEAELLDLNTIAARAGWVQETYITGDTELLSAKEGERLIAQTTKLVEEAKGFDGVQLPPELRRKFKLLKLSLTMPAPSDPKLREKLTQLAASLDGTYGKGKYCAGSDASAPNQAKCIGIDEIDVRMAKSRDPKELKGLWTGWHKVGAPMRDRYAQFVDLSNQGARELGFADTGALWRSNYDMPPQQFSAEIERIWTEVAPLYKELHAYVRKRLIQKYGAVADRKDGMIPADLLGNMWAQEWGNIYDIVAPASAPTYWQ
jgi:peptidyl-dipeptidase A